MLTGPEKGKVMVVVWRVSWLIQTILDGADASGPNNMKLEDNTYIRLDYLILYSREHRQGSYNIQ